MVNAWNRNHGKGPHQDNPDHVGGFLCWDWARIFQDAARAMQWDCFEHQIGMATKTGFALPDGSIPVHYYLEVYACRRKLAEFQVSFDDGFLEIWGGKQFT
jgi:hypothetical protein